MVSVDHLQGKAKGPAQQPVGRGDVPLRHRPADAGGADLFPAVQQGRRHRQFYAGLLTQGRQEGHASLGSLAKAKIFPAAQALGLKPLEQHLADKGLRLPIPDLRKVQGVQHPHPGVLQKPLLVPACEDGAVSRGTGAKGEHRRFPGLSPFAGRAGRVNYRHVAPVQPVKGPQRQRAGPCLRNFLQCADHPHVPSSLSKKLLANTSWPFCRSTRPRPKNCPSGDFTRHRPSSGAFRSRSRSRLPPF